MSGTQDHAHAQDTHHDAHEGPIKTPKQLVVAVLFAFIVPILIIIMLANYVSSQMKEGAGGSGLEEQAVAARIQRVGSVDLKDANAPVVLKTGEQVFQAQCAACHAGGLMGAPKFGDEGAWGPRVKTGFDTLVHSALKGKGAMPPQSGGENSDFEITRAVVYMANHGGAKFDEPKAPAAPASGAASGAEAPASGASQ
ncbi:c-type cytochrome [Roseateles sp.]|uniref:c-type cytochrome n=1 Tax=Roseateles sp. TaxID=1971397 RepID=UPI0031E13B8F